MKEHPIKRIEEYDSFILAATESALKFISYSTMGLVYRLFGIPKERVTLRHAEAFLVSTTLLFILLITIAESWSSWGWFVVVLGNLRIVQIISLNLSTLLFDTTPVGDPTATLKRARWHFVAIGFSFVDTILVFGFMYQFFDGRYGILNQHSHRFFDYLYYAVITIASIGYGDIHPVTLLGRMIAMYEAIVALLFLVFFVSGALSRLSRH